MYDQRQYDMNWEISNSGREKLDLPEEINANRFF
jgi:hypothetical protein